ncbi:hypothetical protein DL89DRAFT_268463 [Linderina pennispora]|uniref:Uncharacterized protein n=1 Tax=Linderina pennispora TaxID=61395 RepID=A0A1Y1W6A1_9FUNG|nr:uncharacterized protein DL89DRAFT_268463 [Linderina pennispora]ORX68684.1 hypothetical protein DL89DRAFT_268463 [Linderina pennispora]
MKQLPHSRQADGQRRVGRGTLASLALIIGGLFYFFALGAKDRMLTLVRVLANPTPDCMYIQPPSLTVLSAESVRIGWRSSCKHSALVKFNSGEVAPHVVSAGPLNSWFEYAADVPVAYGQPTQLHVETDNWALNQILPIRYTSPWSTVAHGEPGNTSLPVFAIGLVDIARISDHAGEPWATELADILHGHRLSFVMHPKAQRGSPGIDGIVHAPPDSASFAAFAGNVCVVATSASSPSKSLEGFGKCAGADLSAIFIDMDWTHRLLYWLGISGALQSRLFNYFSGISKVAGTKAVVIRTNSRLVPVDATSLRPLVPRCSLLGNAIGWCSPPVATVIEQTASGKLQLNVFTVTGHHLQTSKYPIQ